MAVDGGQFGFETRHGAVQRLALALDIGVGNRRIEVFQLRQKRGAGAVIDCAADFRRGIRQARDGLGKQRIIFSHERSEHSPVQPSTTRRLHSCDVELDQFNVTITNIGKAAKRCHRRDITARSPNAA